MEIRRRNPDPPRSVDPDDPHMSLAFSVFWDSPRSCARPSHRRSDIDRTLEGKSRRKGIEKIQGSMARRRSIFRVSMNKRIWRYLKELRPFRTIEGIDRESIEDRQGFMEDPCE